MNMEKEEKKYFKEFKEFLQYNCPDEKIFGEGKYDRKIYNWFNLGKPKKIKKKYGKKNNS